MTLEVTNMIWKNRPHQKFTIKHFTINAIASAVLVFNANIARADSCPPEIAGTSLAGVICDFDTSTSVTVASDGIVGGIAMNSYNPLLSQIVINAGGVINNTTGIGISINNSSLTNGLINNGTISTASTGISINSGSNINGGISNGGSIVSTNGTGIRISYSNTINGGITNTGTISGGSVDEGITILQNNTINGDISNTGLIESNNGNGIIIILSNVINGNISNSGTISAGNTGISLSVLNTLNGSILNTGSIEAGTDGIDVKEGSEASGDISNSGLINAGNIGISIHTGTINGKIENSGTITSGQSGISVASSSIVSGSISNSGTITSSQNGISVTNSSTVNGDISNSGTIQGDTNAIFIDSSSNVDNINILGQQARIIGAVEAVNTDVNITSGATFTSEGTFDVNQFNIASNAVFNMANAITVQNGIHNAGTLAIGNSTQTINGDYTQDSGGILQVGVSSPTNYGQLQVTGAVDMSQSGNINVQVASNTSLHAGDTFTILSGSTLVEPTNGFNVTDNSFFWEFNAVDPSAEVTMTASINPAVYNACRDEYCRGAANTIIGEIAAGNSAFSPYATLATESEFETAASQATPELTNENIQVIQLITRTVTNSVPMWSLLHGQSTKNAMLYQSNKLWFKPYGGAMTQNESNTVDGFNAAAYGIVLGKDIQLTEDWLFGGALSAGRDNMDGKNSLNGQSINSNTYQGILYGSRTFPHNLYFAGQGLIGYGDNNTRRDIPLYSSTAEGTYNSWFTNLRAEVGLNTYLLNESLVLTPEIDASYLFINQGSYQESGSPMDLSVDSSNNSSLVFGAYEHGAYRLTTFNNKQDLTFTAYIGIARDVLNSEPETTATFVAGGSSFNTFGIQINSTVFRSGVGLTFANPTKPFRMNLNYDMQTGNNAYSGMGSVTVAYVI
jgi:uncharacterized protein with beta-barrel porin domain